MINASQKNIPTFPPLIALDTTQPYQDKELLRRIAEGDERAFRIFFDQHKERFYAIVRKMTRSDSIAQEMVQEIFVRIWQKRESLTHILNPDSYFVTILYNQVNRHYKKLALERKLLQLIAESPQFQDITDQTVLARESERLINEAVALLPPQQQLVFRMSKQEGMSREQIAKQLHISPNTVRNHLADAIGSIRNYLGRAAMIYVLIMAFTD